MFQLTSQEAKSLRSQSVILDAAKQGRGRYSKYAPYVFTEHGIAMLSSVLRSKRAVQTNIMIIRALIRLREMLINHKDLAVRVEKIETVSQRDGAMIGVLAGEILRLKKTPPYQAAVRISGRKEELVVQNRQQCRLNRRV
jgi:hypothetical protein